jgi:hypothetical protein
LVLPVRALFGLHNRSFSSFSTTPPIISSSKILTNLSHSYMQDVRRHAVRGSDGRMHVDRDEYG